MVKPFEYAVALTGSIGTGKSTAANILTGMGFAMIDADHISHFILDEEHQKVSDLFGEHLVHEVKINGKAKVNCKSKVNRKALGAIVFADAEKRKILEALLHPLIYERIASLAEQLDAKKTPYLVDIPLFFENKHYPIDKSLVVFTSELLQLSRLMRRENYSEETAKKRIATQININEKAKWADYVIDNSGTLTQLEHECKRVRDAIEKDFR